MRQFTCEGLYLDDDPEGKAGFAPASRLLLDAGQSGHTKLFTPFADEVGLKRTEAHTGAVTPIQRFGLAANLNIHLHCLVLDGVYRMTEGGPVFQQARAPSIEGCRPRLTKSSPAS
jgi:hypothetical protein